MPFYGTSNASTYWNSTRFDIMGREQTIVSADGASTTTMTYNGLSTVVTQVGAATGAYDAVTQSKTQVSNVMGDTVSVTDSAGSISYNYNASGNLIQTTGVDGAAIITHFDDYGRKISMVDPDKGAWSYRYNALGEMVSQTDARGFVTTNQRDVIGRVKSKTVTGRHEDLSVVNETTTYEFSQHRLMSEYIVGDNFKRCYSYDSLGRTSQVTTMLDGRGCYADVAQTIVGVKYTERTTFDGYGRVFQQFDAKGDSYGVRNHYQNGYLKTQYEARTSGNSNKPILMDVLAMDAQGHVTSVKDANGKTTSRAYDAANGLLSSIITDEGKLQNIEYKYDSARNLRKRNNISSGIEQDFSFDDLNRLTDSTGYMPQSLTYDNNGNILTKSDVQAGATYQYNNGNNGSHAVTNIGSLSYQYDANGNQTKAFDNGVETRAIRYSHFDKPTFIDGKNNGTTQFSYDSNRSRYKRVDVKGGQTTTTYYIGNLEVVTLPSGVVETKRYIANALQVSRSNDTNNTQYLYKDMLGSLDTVTNARGKRGQVI